VARTISSFKSAIASSASLMGQTFDYEQSVATKLMADEFGGNSHSTFIVCLSAGHSPVINYGLLEFLSGLREMVVYPVRNDANVHALFSFLRVCVFRIYFCIGSGTDV
jgi:hypothetical protein